MYSHEPFHLYVLRTADCDPRPSAVGRRHELYPMSWAECDWTERTLVCVASTGGPIAVCRDVTNSAVPIMIYNGAGESLGLAKVRRGRVWGWPRYGGRESRTGQGRLEAGNVGPVRQGQHGSVCDAPL